MHVEVVAQDDAWEGGTVVVARKKFIYLRERCGSWGVAPFLNSGNGYRVHDTMHSSGSSSAEDIQLVGNSGNKIVTSWNSW
ncbi:hypothetical protein VNO78_34370 [Psophocarpus tetragonolobus]|uniref:Uncharacterized protein n=1 Tax=Psophocarpus tetragonolobus TaxID=3891 RepID=A0AAN9NUZ8_PSOTE